MFRTITSWCEIPPRAFLPGRVASGGESRRSLLNRSGLWKGVRRESRQIHPSLPSSPPVLLIDVPKHDVPDIRDWKSVPNLPILLVRQAFIDVRAMKRRGQLAIPAKREFRSAASRRTSREHPDRIQPSPHSQSTFPTAAAPGNSRVPRNNGQEPLMDYAGIDIDPRMSSDLRAPNGSPAHVARNVELPARYLCDPQ